MPAQDELITHYPMLASLPHFTDSLDKHALLSIPAKMLLFQEGDTCRGFPLLLKGQIRVFKQSENGREIELYRIEPGESCIISTTCLIQHTPYQARAETETDTLLYQLNPTQFERNLQHPGFCHYVLTLYSERVIDLMEQVENVAFRSLEARLAARLLGHGSTIHITHAQLARELGSVREIISRLLKRLEIGGSIHLNREHIDIIDPRALRQIAENP